MAVRDHQAGHPEVSFTEPLANIIRKRSQRTRERLIQSWLRARLSLPGETGLARTARRPVSSRRMSHWKWRKV